jgi:hypothetical protein
LAVVRGLGADRGVQRVAAGIRGETMSDDPRIQAIVHALASVENQDPKVIEALASIEHDLEVLESVRRTLASYTETQQPEQPPRGTHRRV